jgi:hypothetical protein
MVIFNWHHWGILIVTLQGVAGRVFLPVGRLAGQPAGEFLGFLLCDASRAGFLRLGFGGQLGLELCVLGSQFGVAPGLFEREQELVSMVFLHGFSCGLRETVCTRSAK